MTPETAIIIIGILLAFGIAFYILNKRLSEIGKPKSDETLLEWIKSMQAKVDETNKAVNEALRSNSSVMIKTLQENSKQLNERLDNAAKIISGVQRNIGEMSEIGRNMRELQDFLKSPKLRGNIGEQVLKDLISQMFPKSGFFLQYQFKSGEKVDAAIKTDAGILPIDSKFPMENFQKMSKAQTKEEKTVFQKEFIKDVRKHIDAVSKKYILPDEGTMDFALLYVPSESVYYEIVNLPELLDEARKKRVYFVSPSTLYAHLQTILLSFEGKKIELKSREILKMLRSMQIDFNKVDDNLGVLGKHLNNASAQFHNVSSGFAQIGNKLKNTRHIEEKMEEELLLERR